MNCKFTQSPSFLHTNIGIHEWMFLSHNPSIFSTKLYKQMFYYKPTKLNKTSTHLSSNPKELYSNEVISSKSAFSVLIRRLFKLNSIIFTLDSKQTLNNHYLKTVHQSIVIKALAMLTMCYYHKLAF